MKLLLINNDGGGYADYVEIPEGQTVRQLFEARLPNASASNYLIRVNRQPCSEDQVLEPGDRISLTPVKIEGAAA